MKTVAPLLGLALLFATTARAQGGDAAAVRQRWKAKPERCQSAEAWDAAAGTQAQAVQARARISGAAPSTGGGIHPKVFGSRAPSGDLPSNLGADGHLARLACGLELEGVDPWFDEDRHLWTGQLFVEGSDPRVVMSHALQTVPPDGARATLYRTALLHHCYAATEWKLPDHYLPFLYCEESLHSVPSIEQVEAAIVSVFPARDWERDNLLFATRRALEARSAVVAAFADAEAKAPRMRAVFRDSGDEARQRHAAFRTRHAEALRTLEPLTKAALNGDPSAMPADCEAQLLALRTALATELAPKDAEGIRLLRVGHPLGFQITEALAACHLSKGRLAAARLEADALAQATRRVSEEEETFFSRQDAMWQARKELPTEAQLQQAMPNWESRERYPAPLPPTVIASNKLVELVRGARGSLEYRGKSDRVPAVVATRHAQDGGVLLVFEKVVYPYQDFRCTKLDKVHHYEIRGNTVQPVYEEDCRPVGPVKKRIMQEKAVLFPPEQAALVKKGMQVEVLVNEASTGDAVLVNLWKAKDRKSPLILDGIRVH